MKRRGRRVSTPAATQISRYGFVVFLVVFSLVPFYWLILSAFDTKPQLWLTPVEFTFQNFVNFFVQEQGFLWMGNSLIYAVGTVVLVLVASTLGGYMLSRLKFWWKTPFLYFIILIRVIPNTTYLVPLFKLISNLGLMDTYFAVILVDASGSLPIALWVMKTFFDTIQPELEEAVWIDGGTRWTSLTRVVFPLSAPAAAAVAILTFRGSWGTFLTPVLFITSDNKTPLGVAIFRAYITSQYIDYGFLAALAIVYIAPIIVLVLYARRHLIKSFNLAGVKG
ncbi:MAG: carbohydrate ABC transporter permease [Spirochaetales bacterium]|nr:carbohydrate ABC transporter permease [Spirochaetales bacterium]